MLKFVDLTCHAAGAKEVEQNGRISVGYLSLKGKRSNHQGSYEKIGVLQVSLMNG